MKTELNNNGGYEAEGVIWHQHSNRLLKKIIEYFPNNIPVTDIGCGHNFYISILRYLGNKNAWGVDLVDLGSRYFVTQDVTEPVVEIDEISNVISLEVGEHIPEELASNYLDNITAFKGDVIMSWAIPGQEGIGHINCQTNDWVISEMKARGYEIDVERTAELRGAVYDCHCSWFKNTLFYFFPNK